MGRCDEGWRLNREDLDSIREIRQLVTDSQAATLSDQQQRLLITALIIGLGISELYGLVVLVECHAANIGEDLAQAMETWYKANVHARMLRKRCE